MNATSDFGTVKILMLKGEKGDTGETGGTRDYEELENKPSIESVTLIGEQTFRSLGLEALSNAEIEELLTQGGF